ncbi:ABC transporter permease subunit [Brachybacterium hainanense]|uniref:ABC transporter permease subunit n=1 Tax=Brachybacterium hainanense TaxID=1541174 RepID=A0ABV6R9W9_9MICO
MLSTVDALVALNQVIPNATDADQFGDDQLTALSLASPGTQQTVVDLLGNSGGGMSVPAITALLLGALTITTEYRRGSLTTTALAEPRRIRLLGAKLAALALTVLIASAGLALARALMLGIGLGIQGEALLLDPARVAASWALGALALILYAGVGFAVGILVRSPITAILTLGAAIVVESLIRPFAMLILGAPNPVQYLPFGLVPDLSGTNPLAALTGSDAPLMTVLPTGTALFTLLCWTLLVVTAASLRFRRADTPALM